MTLKDIFGTALLLVVSQLIGISSAGSSSGVSFPQVKIANGTVIGNYNKVFNQDVFLGVPFAAPPVGDLRFRPPQPFKNKLGNIDARAKPKVCYGYGGDQVEGFEQSEDCLILNIFRPAGLSSQSNLPVAVWIHGGSFIGGGGGDPRYNLSWIVDQSTKLKTPVIGISINYRLSVWGFISGREAGGTGSTNIGLKDQRAAFQWIQENIKAFGGDPKKVTLFGESAGAVSIGLQLTAYGGRNDNLFRYAIMQSGAPVNYAKISSPETYQGVMDSMAATLGCTDAPDRIQCLRGASATDINTFLNAPDSSMLLPRFFVFQPVVDGDFVPEYGSQLLKKGKYVKIPTIIGTTSDEGTAYASALPFASQDEDGLRLWLKLWTNLSENSANTLINLYNSSVSIPVPEDLQGVETPAELGPIFHRTAALTGDVFMQANKRYTANTMVSDNVPVWSYKFKATPNGVPAYLGAGHFSEVAFVMNNYNGVGYPTNPLGGPNAAKYRALAESIAKYWIRFINTGNPNTGSATGPNVITWPKYQDRGGMAQIVFDIAPKGLSVEKDAERPDGISFINKYALQIGR